MSPFHSLDLFSGVGGMTRALECIAQPIAYCEIDPMSQSILKARMADGDLPKAHLFDDVKKVTKASLRRETGRSAVDMIVGGWPCQDLSILGTRKGLIHGARSGLIFEVIRLTDELKPKMLFLENVPAVMGNGIDIIIDEFVRKRGYEMRWCIIPAVAVGALHVRKRWFCFLVAPAFKSRVVITLPPYTPFSWNMKDLRRKSTPGGRVPVMTMFADRFERRYFIQRARTLGNSVVPDCVRAAFITLASGYRATPSARMLKETRSLRIQAPDEEQIVRRPDGTPMLYKSWGVARRNRGGIVDVWRVKKPRLPQSARISLVVDPATFHGPTPKHPVTRGLLKQPKHLHSFHTPRHESHASNILTERTVRDLATTIRYERQTPDEVRSGVLAPEFVEWLMGYPVGWSVGVGGTKIGRFTIPVSRKKS